MATDQPVNGEEEQLPVAYEYCVRVYEAMTNEASLEELGTGYGDEEGMVWDGFTTKLIRDLGLPVPYYTKILGELQRMDCIRQLRRGGSTTTSRWLLLQEPTPELFLNSIQRKRQATSWREIVEQQIRDLTRQVGEMQDIVNALVEATNEKGA